MIDFNIAIDGPSGAGKSSVAKVVASKLGLTYIDTGSMYRSIAYTALAHDVDINNVMDVESFLPLIHLSFNEENHVCVNGIDVEDNIRQEHISKAASIVAKYSCVREKCVKSQQQFAKQGACIMDGRDIGSVVLPDAKVKIYLDASVVTRAKRRYQQNLEKGLQCTYEDVEADVKERDYRDTHRENSPLVMVEDAIKVDSSELSFDQTVDTIISIINSKKGTNHD